MALLKIEKEMERARPGAAFSTLDDGASWMAIWCDECTKEPQCPLLTVVILNRTPGPWLLRDAAAVNKYTCTEFEGSTGAQAPPV